MKNFLLKKHQTIWRLLLVAVPLLMVLSVIMRPAPSPQNGNDELQNIVNRGELLKYAENDFLELRLKTIHGDYYAELVIKQPLKAASSVVYSTTDTVIGQIESFPVCRFKTGPDLAGIVVKDNLKQRTITQLNF
ncbi:MAG: hypothetical protein JJ975_06200 [Bacteroidia bacterium]|nr:hypothetical protein [Bacteroidia bacterium]